MSGSSALLAAAEQLPWLLAGGWLVRFPALSREEGHEAITRAAWEGLGLTEDLQRALIRGVRAPDVGPLGLIVSTLPFAQRRHALRAWSGTTTADAVRDVRRFLAATHRRALAAPDGPRRWALFGELLHCLQDSFSPAHVERDGGQIIRVKHWGPLDGLRRSGTVGDEHGFPSDSRDSAWTNGKLTDEAQAAVAATRGYLEMVTPGSAAGTAAPRSGEMAAFLDAWVAPA